MTANCIKFAVFIWHKINCYPGKMLNLFQDSWELLQVNKSRKWFNLEYDTVLDSTRNEEQNI